MEGASLGGEGWEGNLQQQCCQKEDFSFLPLRRFVSMECHVPFLWKLAELQYLQAEVNQSSLAIAGIILC